jgi:cytochrome c biogenesis protein CcmG, thiol:disulfide interchange protein DsbE
VIRRPHPLARTVGLLTLLAALSSTGPAPASEGELTPGWIGIVFQPRDDGAFVKLVLPGMPAEAAGLRRGDLLLQADGAPLADLDIPGVRDTIAGTVGTRLTLLVRRAASETEISVDRIERPDDATIASLRDEAELQAAPAHQRASKLLGRLDEDAGPDRVREVWSAYLTERGDAPIREPVVLGALGSLQRMGGVDATEVALTDVLPAADADLADEPRYQRRIADFLLAVDPPRPSLARQRAQDGLEHAPSGHREHPWLQRALAAAALLDGDLVAADRASAAALESWPPPTLIWLDESGGELDRRVVDGHSRLARSRAEVLVARDDPAAARAVLADRLAHRHDDGTAEALTALGGTPPPPPRPAFPLNADPFPDFVLPALEGDEPIALADLRGRPLLIALWASWCGPCKAELAHLAEAYPALQEQGVEVLAINVMEDRAAGVAHARAAGWTFPVAHDRDKTLTRALGLQSIPRSYVLDSDGLIARMNQGWSEASAGEQEILLTELAGGGSASPFLLSVEVGDDRLELVRFHPLTGARALTALPGEQERLLVGTATGRLLPLDGEGLDEAGERTSPYKIQDVLALPDDTWIAVGKKHVALLPADGEPATLQFDTRVAAAAVSGALLVVGPGGRRPLRAFDATGAELWSGGDEAVTWDLVPLGTRGNAPAVGRLRPDGLEVVAGSQSLAHSPLPLKASHLERAGQTLLLGAPLRAADTGDLDGDGIDETVVLLDTRRVLGLSSDGELLFRLVLPMDGDLACADLDGDGRDELWLASPAAGVAALVYHPSGSGGSSTQD